MAKKFDWKRYELWIAVFVLFFCELFFFRNVLSHNALISDTGDGKLTNLLTEHWFRALCGKEGFSELSMFYPAKDVLGYTDLFLLFAPIYCIFRALGLNLFLAYKYTLMLVHAFGTASMYMLCRRTLRLHPMWALFSTFAFSFSSSFARNLVHTQLLAISFLPLLLILFICFFRTFEDHKKRDLYAILAIAWFAGITYTSWYVAYFTGLFVLTMLGMYWLCLLLWRKPFLKLLWEKLRFLSWHLVVYIAWLVLLYLPFLRIYLPVLRSASGYSIGDVWVYQPTVKDLINVSSENLLQGPLVERLGLEEKALTPELAEGFSVFYLIFWVLAAVCFFLRFAKRKDDKREPERGYDEVLLVALIPTVLCSLVLVMRFDVTNFHLWRIAYRIVPFATSVRAIARYWLWLSFPMAVSVAKYADALWKPTESKKSFAWALVAVILIFVANIEKEGVCSEWKLDEECEALEGISEAPAGMTCFYITDPVHVWEDNQNADIVYNQLFAYALATCYDLKTINGYSGQEPVGWHGIENVFLDAYEGAVFDWFLDHELTGVYAYSMKDNRWMPAADRYEGVLDEVFCPANDDFSVNSGLLEYEPAECVWCSQETEITIQNDEVAKKGLTIDLSTHLKDFKKQLPEVEPKLEIYVNDTYVSDFPMIDGQTQVTIPVKEAEKGIYRVRLSCNTYFNPKETGVNLDPRDLCLQLFYIGD